MDDLMLDMLAIEDEILNAGDVDGTSETELQELDAALLALLDED